MNKIETFINEWETVESAMTEWNNLWEHYVASCCNNWSWTQDDVHRLRRSKENMEWAMFKAFCRIYNADK